MSDNPRTTQETREPQEAGQRAEKQRIELNLGRLAAGALAAVTAAALCSRLGVAGTLVGTGVISLVSGAASVIYQRSLERTRTVVSTTRRKITDNGLSMNRVLRVDRGPDAPSDTADDRTEQFAVDSAEVDAEADETGPRGVWASLRSYLHSPRRRWVIAGAGALLTFVVALGAVAGLELLRGESLSGQSHGTTVGAIFGGGGASHNHPAPAHPVPTTSSSSTPPSAPGTPTHSPSTAPNAPSPTSTPTPTTSPTPTPTRSPSTTPSPTGQAPTKTAPPPTAPPPTATVTPSTR